MNARAAALIGACVLVLVGCSKTYRVGDNVSNVSTAGGNEGEGGGPSVAVSGSGGLGPAQCDGSPQPGPAPLSRLTNPELVNTIRALLGSSDLEDMLLGSDAGRYEASPDVDVSAETIDRLHSIAHVRAESIAAQPALLEELTSCKVAISGEAACKAQLYERFVARAFRRPLTAADEAEMDAVYADGKALGGSYESGARAVIEVTLQSPEFVYLVTEGDGAAEGDLVPLTGHETASRLAYFLTGAPPDDLLWQAAAGGRLDDETIASHARRLLGTPQNRQQLRAFFSRHLRLAWLEPSDAVGYSPELVELTRESTFRFVEDVTFDSEGTFHTLMTSPTTFMNAKLANFYGVPGVTGDALQRVTFALTERRGLLTQPGYLRASSPGEFTRPVLRGIEVLDGVLCLDLPPPPASIPTLLEPTGPMTTMRERLTSATADPTCAACHNLINPIGLAFENYDAFGRYRTTEDGAPIDASGTLSQTDAAGPFANALELIDRIASSSDAAVCFQKHWLTEAYRRHLDEADRCEVERVTSALDANGGKITDLLVTVAQSANLKYRPKAE